MYLNPYMVPFVISGLIILGVAVRAFRLRKAKGAIYLSLLALSAGIYSLAYAMEISSQSLDSIMFWIRIEYLGIVMIPVFLILFALAYSGREKDLSPVIKGCFYILPLVTLIMLYTNHHHGLFYSSILLDTAGPFPILEFERGIWYWVHSTYIVVAYIFSIIIFLQMWLNANRAYRKQFTVMLTGSLVPWAGFIFYLFRPFSWELDTNPLFLSLGALIFYLGISRYRLLDLIPVARASLFEKLPDGVIVLDSALRIADLNTAARQLMQLPAVAIGRPAAEVFSGWTKLAKLIKSAENNYHVELPCEPSNQPRWFRIEFIPLQHTMQKAGGQMIIIRDVTDRKLTERKLEYLAATDDLTGLWNRRFFIETAQKEIKRCRRYNRFFSLLLLDIDRFKEVNDQHGHSAGDKTLQHLASSMRERLREVDIPARIGGEEFGIILPETGLNQAYNLAEELRINVANSALQIDDKEIRYTISIGIAAYNTGLAGVDDLLKAADQALYRAKDLGRNQTVVK